MKRGGEISMDKQSRPTDQPQDRRRSSASQRRASSAGNRSSQPQRPATCGGRKLCLISFIVGIIVAIGAGFGAGYLVYAYTLNDSGNLDVMESDDLPAADFGIQTDNASESVVLESKDELKEPKRIGIDSSECGKLGEELSQRFRGFSGDVQYRNKRIVGGKFTSLQNFPWQVSLWTRNRHTCGGSIISSNWIVTAAHCTHPYPAPENWTVYAGATYISEMEAEANLTQVVALSDVVSHPEFDPTTYDNDVALMRMEHHLIMNDHISPICLPNADEETVAGQVCAISGWGALSEGGIMPNKLQEATVRVIDLKVCNADNWLMGLVTDLMICAGTEDGSMDACQGDSGGPLSCKRESNSKIFLPGLVSWGIGCGEERMPGVYTDMRLYKSWIVQNVQSVELRYE
ncbi:trypsin-1-like isoform X2 [Styela clava]